MSPPDAERRPATEPDGVSEPHIAGGDTSKATSALPPDDDDLPRYEWRAGAIVRVNVDRKIVASCRDCPGWFVSTGPAASHSRSARHRVDVVYSATFTFAPGELLDRVVR